MNEQLAAEVIRRSLSVTAELDDLVRLARDSRMEDEEYQHFRRTMGRAMGELYVELLLPLFKTYPHLAPDDLAPPAL